MRSAYVNGARVLSPQPTLRASVYLYRRAHIGLYKLVSAACISGDGKASQVLSFMQKLGVIGTGDTEYGCLHPMHYR